MDVCPINPSAAFLQNASISLSPFPGFHPGLVCMAPLEPKTLLIENTTKYRNTTKYLSLKSGDGPLNPAMDYDRDAPITQAFFAKVQNKMHYAVHGQTAAELIIKRADHTRERMGLTNWGKAPGGKVLKSDVVVAKNYLTEAELEDLGRIVSAYLDLAESRAKRRVPMTMEDWAKRLDIFLAADEREVLQDAGRISAEIAREHPEGEFEKYRVIQDKLFQSDFDTFAALEKPDEEKREE